MAAEIKKPITDVNAPRPVHPTAVRTHGLFGIPYVRQHWMVDEHWTPSSLTEQFKGMGDLLEKRNKFKELEDFATFNENAVENRRLKRQIRDGRIKLQMSMYGENTKKIRNFLIHHKDMQRLYQKMPIHMIVDNINQRTFVMRKERDRLRFRLAQMKRVYNNKLIEHAVLENRFKYENEFVLEEDLKSREFRKKIENSNVRLKAVKTINSTYKKMIQILRHDSIFYEPILRSLSKDIEDQSNFIKHILYLGMPAIAKFKVLSDEYRIMEDKTRKNLQAKLQWLTLFKKNAIRRTSSSPPKQQQQQQQQEQQKHEQQHNIHLDDEQQPAPSKLKRYVRETVSMQFLKNELEEIETIIKQVQFATLCSHAKDLYPRIKSQVENNLKLRKMIENDLLGHRKLEISERYTKFVQGELIHDLSQEEVDRKLYIQSLQEQIQKEDAIEASTIAHMKNRADAYVLLRFTIWNLHEILRHVDRPPKIIRKTYATSYLKLPLLKFEMFSMRACPPEIYDENIDILLDSVKHKVSKLMKIYKKDLGPDDIKHYRAEYHQIFLESIAMDEEAAEASEEHHEVEEEVDELDIKQQHAVPVRYQIKQISAKIVEENLKKED